MKYITCPNCKKQNISKGRYSFECQFCKKKIYNDIFGILHDQKDEDYLINYIENNSIPLTKQSRGLTPFMLALERGYSLKVLSKLIDEDKSVFYIPNSYGELPIEIAKKISPKISDEIYALLLNNTVIKDNNETNCDSLISAIMLGKPIDFILDLIKSNSDINIQDNFGETALFKVIRKTFCYNEDEQFQIIEHLLKSGADVNIKNKYGNDILIISFECKTPLKSIELLLKNGCDLVSKEKIFLRIIGYRYLEEYYYQILELMHKYGLNISKQGINGIPLLFYSIIKGKPVNYITTLIKIGCNINDIDKKGETILLKIIQGTWCYSQHELFQIIEFLLKYGANVNIQNQYHKTPLMLSINRGYSWKIIELLVKTGSNLEIIDEYGETALFKIIRRIEAYSEKEQYQIIELLVKNGADVNKRSYYPNTPLLLAVKCHNSLRIIELLLKECNNQTKEEVYIELFKKKNVIQMMKFLILLNSYVNMG